MGSIEWSPILANCFGEIESWTVEKISWRGIRRCSHAALYLPNIYLSGYAWIVAFFSRQIILPADACSRYTSVFSDLLSQVNLVYWWNKIYLCHIQLWETNQPLEASHLRQIRISFLDWGRFRLRSSRYPLLIKEFFLISAGNSSHFSLAIAVHLSNLANKQYCQVIMNCALLISNWLLLFSSHLSKIFLSPVIPRFLWHVISRCTCGVEWLVS